MEKAEPRKSKDLTLDLLFPLPPAKKDDSPPVPNVMGAPRKLIRWLKGGTEYLELIKDMQDKPQLVRVNALSGSSRPLYDTPRLEAALLTLPHLTQEQATNIVTQGEPSYSPDESAVLIAHSTGLFYIDLATNPPRVLQLTNPKDPKENAQVPTFSPDGRQIAFVRQNNLFTVNLVTGQETQCTHDGEDAIFNGMFDWIYQEELYGRGNFKGFWWSPDSKKLAFLRLDERHVPSFTVIDHRPQHVLSEITRYPKAGDPNPFVQLGIIHVNSSSPPSSPFPLSSSSSASSSSSPPPHSSSSSPSSSSLVAPITWIDLTSYKPEDLLIVSVSWKPHNSDVVVFQAMNKEQTWLDLNLASTTTGQLEARLLRETTPAWVNVLSEPQWDEAGETFLWESERSGHRHIYHINQTGDVLCKMTHGDWDVEQVHGVDRANGYVYFSANKEQCARSGVYRVKLAPHNSVSSGLSVPVEPLLQGPGTHAVHFNEDFSYMYDVWSSLTVPHQIRLHQANGSLVREIDVASSRKVSSLLSPYWSSLPQPEFLSLNTKDGCTLEALLIRPNQSSADLAQEKDKKYPVLLCLYGGPNAPLVRDTWKGPGLLWYQYLAQQGIMVWVCDNRTASGKGIHTTWDCYRNFGELETRDQLEGLEWLSQNYPVDPSRIAVFGWSYGGYMAAYLLTHSKIFKAGIAIAPVTDWTLYDSIYTERYMGTPQNNPTGYSKSSVLEAAGDLHGNLLLLHGTMDDNVHLQQTVQLIDRLQKAQKHNFQLMLYPGARHGVVLPEWRRHLYDHMTQFLKDQLKP
eukprot:gb/GEZN01001895.1/.p1 GENE.gb/GEZN01001895.1/~~gb/GEZN01001895.1/.p1  ORF type:complete len:844 (+),score=167.11 gb/GEZN01001895.1/:144-2534(+)